MKETSVNMKFVRFGQVLTEVIEENRIVNLYDNSNLQESVETLRSIFLYYGIPL